MSFADDDTAVCICRKGEEVIYEVCQVIYIYNLEKLMKEKREESYALTHSPTSNHDPIGRNLSVDIEFGTYGENTISLYVYNKSNEHIKLVNDKCRFTLRAPSFSTIQTKNFNGFANKYLNLRQGYGWDKFYVFNDVANIKRESTYGWEYQLKCVINYKGFESDKDTNNNISNLSDDFLGMFESQEDTDVIFMFKYEKVEDVESEDEEVLGDGKYGKTKVDENHIYNGNEEEDVKKNDKGDQTREDEYSDKDGSKEVRAHKCILKARSVYFRNLFKSGMVESQTNRIEVINHDLCAFKEMLKFLYTNKTPENLKEIGLKLLPITEQYVLPDLKKMCVKSIQANVTNDNLKETMLLSHTYDLRHVMIHCFQHLNNLPTESRNTFWEGLKRKERYHFDFLILEYVNYLSEKRCFISY